MPFDGSDFTGQGGKRRRSFTDNMVTIMIVGVAVGLLLFPISLGALVDIVRFLHRG